MTTIYRYDIPIQDQFELRLPEFARVLCVAERGGTGHMWVFCDPKHGSAKMVTRRFRVIGTGHEIPDAGMLDYIGTFFMRGGNLVWHVFEATL